MGTSIHRLQGAPIDAFVTTRFLGRIHIELDRGCGGITDVPFSFPCETNQILNWIMSWQALKRLVYVAKEDVTKVGEYSARLKTEIDKESPVKTPRPARALNCAQ